MAKHSSPSRTTVTTTIATLILILVTATLIAILALAGKLTTELIDAFMSILRIVVPLLNLNRYGALT